MLLQIGAAYLLQNGAGIITNWGSYYKLGQTLLQIGAAITNWGITSVFREIADLGRRSLVI